MKSKGFTLIELLAVIVILAIIALIATPLILRVVENARKSAALSSAYGYIDAVEKAIIINEMDATKTNIPNETITVSDLQSTYGVKAKGSLPEGTGTVTIQKQKVTGATLKIGKYDITCDSQTCTVSGSSSGNSSSNSNPTPNSDSEPVVGTYNTYSLGQLVQYDPVANTSCTSGDTCYKWRVIVPNDSTSNSKITLQMDHNLVTTNRWSSLASTTTGPNAALSALATATADWNSALLLNYTYDTTASPNNYGTLTCTAGTCSITGNATPIATNLKARLITGEEITEMVVAKGVTSDAYAHDWTLASPSNSRYYFSDSNHLLGTRTISMGEGSRELEWLSENTNANETSGATSNTYGDICYGYWSLSPVADYPGRAWGPNFNGTLNDSDVDVETYYGLRPVITIPKDQIS